jgi:HAD superfamily hydrolase (TIGR01509 family)
LITHWINPKAVEALLFDVDGTLAETELEGHLPAFNEAFAELNIPWVWSAQHYGELLKVTGGLERMRAHAQASGQSEWLTVDGEARLLEVHQLKNRLFAERMRLGLVTLRPGIAALIEQAVSASMSWGVVTTTSRANWEALWCSCLQGLGVPEPDVVVCGEDVVRKKPDPEAYALAAHRLNLEASACLAIEDSPNGLLAAHGAGMPCVVVTSVFFETGPWPGARAVLSSPLELQVGVPAGPQCRAAPR